MFQLMDGNWHSKNHLRMSIDEFYIMIDEFMEKTKKEQKKILYTLL